MLAGRTKFVFWISVLAIVVACVPSTGAPTPAIDPNQVNVFIAQTANAVRTQTAAAIPTSTATEIPTQTPTNTFTPSPTFTSTVIFVLASPTPSVTPTSTFYLGGGGTSSNDFACEVMSVSPANGTIFDSRVDFDAVWKVKNIGQRNWNENSIDYVYDSGTRMHKVDGYDLSSDTRSGATTNIIVDMVAPRDPGSYRTTWVLRSGGTTFCTMSITINVR